MSSFFCLCSMLKQILLIFILFKMRFSCVKIILILTFSVFLVHDYLPHLHFDENSEIHSHHLGNDEQDHDDDSSLSHNIDHVFVSKKHEQLPLTFKIISVAVEPINLSAGITGSFTLKDSCEPVNPHPFLNELSPRAPPVV